MDRSSRRRLSRLALGTAISLSLGVAPAFAALTWNEAGDAGQTLPTANVPTGGGNLPQINGSIGSSGDADLYKVCLGGSAFSADTNNMGTTLGDSQLFLFNAKGFGVIFNDDTVGLKSHIDVAAPTPGTYYIGVSGFNTDPVDSKALPIFPNTFDGQHGPIAGRGFLANWSGASGIGDYNITLTGTNTVNGLGGCP